MRNVVNNGEIIAEVISAVYAVRGLDGRPKFLFCYPDSSYTYVFVQHQKTRVEPRVREGKWQDLPILQSGMYFDKGWTNIRVKPQGKGSLKKCCLELIIRDMLGAAADVFSREGGGSDF